MGIILVGSGVNFMSSPGVLTFQILGSCAAGQMPAIPNSPQWEPSFPPNGAPGPMGTCLLSRSWAWASHALFLLLAIGAGTRKNIIGGSTLYVLYSSYFYYFVFLEISSICCLKSKSRCFTKKVPIKGQVSNSFYIGRLWFSEWWV